MLESIPLSTIIVGVSGGVDSTVAAYLLKQTGHQVSAVFMKNWQDDDEFCPAREDLAVAEKICEQLEIELSVVNFADQYWEHVFSHFLTIYQAGRTPNPDILCNKEIKFAAFLNYARSRGADYIATGHYARLDRSDTAVYLKKARDLTKDQSYFLHALSSNALAQSVFPLGDLTKNEVRVLAKKLGFVNHDRKDSTGICFIGERKFKTFLNNYLPTSPGEIITTEDEVIGTHDGLMFYTIGQRQGLKIGGQKNKPETAWYVAQKRMQQNQLVVVQGDANPALFKQTLYVESMHWINSPPSLPARLQAKTRYRQADQACRVTVKDGGYQVDFEEAQRAITPGQYLVLYQDDICLGGGIIEV